MTSLPLQSWSASSPPLPCSSPHLTTHLIREKRKYHAIFENTENGVLLVNLPDHAILEQNQRFASRPRPHVR